MKKYTLNDIRALRPCYDPIKYLSEDSTYSMTDILNVSKCPAKDRIWVAVKMVPERMAHEFACDAAEMALFLYSEDPDQRSIDVIYGKRAWLNGEITDDKLRELRSAADAAAWAAAYAAADAYAADAADAAAATDAADAAAAAAAADAADAAAATDAADAADATDAADAAAATDAAYAADAAAEREWQVEHLKKMIKEEG
jgi:hypothetical protein